MVYIWNKDGQVVFHTDKKFAVEVEKLPVTPDLEMSEEEFYAKQPIRIVDGKFTFGKTEEELSQEEAAAEEDPDVEPTEIDNPKDALNRIEDVEFYQRRDRRPVRPVQEVPYPCILWLLRPVLYHS